MKTVPAICVVRKPKGKDWEYDIVYGICKFDALNRELHFLSLPSYPSAAFTVSMADITESTLLTVSISQIQLLRRASVPLYHNENVDDQYYSMTCSCNNQTPESDSESRIRKYLKYILMQFDSDIIAVLKELSGQVDSNALLIRTSDGYEHVLVSSIRNTHIIEHFIEYNTSLQLLTRKPIVKQDKFFRKQKRERTTDQTIVYEMSSNEVIFPIREFSDVDCITLSKSSQKQSKKIAAQQNCIDAATERLVRLIYNLNDAYSYNITQYFYETTTTIVSLTQLIKLLQCFPEDLSLNFQSIVVVFSIADDGRWLQTMLQQIPVYQIYAVGITALLGHNQGQQRQISYYQCVNKFCLLAFRTARYTLALLFSSFPKDTGAYTIKQMWYYACEDSYTTLKAAYENVTLTRRPDGFTIQIGGAVFVRLENDLKTIYSSMFVNGCPVIDGNVQGSLCSVELVSLEAWRFLYY